MAKRTLGWSLGVFSLWAASMAWGSGVPVSAASTMAAPAKPAFAVPAKSAKPKAASPGTGNVFASGNLEATTAPGTPAQESPKPALAEAFIAQTVLRVYLNHPASLYVYNSRGQQIYRLDTQRPMEAVPLQGMSTGFVYLTVRTAQGEMTKKLVFTGK